MESFSLANLNSIDIYSFGHYDRSGKIRWLAEEVGLTITEYPLKVGEHRQNKYRHLNPYAAIPTVVFNQQTLIESTAVCHFIAESFPDRKLTVLPGDDDRYNFLKWMGVSCETIESRLVDYAVSKSGLMAAEVQTIYEQTLCFKLRVLVKQLPRFPFLVAERLTIADIVTSYILKLGIVTELIEWSEVSDYLKPLADRPAAQRAQFFDSIMKFMN